MRLINKSITGFTLMEVVLTSVIVSFGFALLMRGLSMAMSTDKYLEYRITALNLANERMEQVKNTSFSDSTLDLGQHPEYIIIYFPFVSERRTTVSFVDGDSDGSLDTDLKKVEVEVYWTQKGALHNVKIETLICDY